MASHERSKARTLRCSFCARRRDQVNQLVAGPGIYICDTCVNSCVELLNDESPVPKVRPWEIEHSLDEILEMLPAVMTAVAQADQYLVHWVRKARTLGATWARIGAALQMTRQSAWERFASNDSDLQ